MKSKKNALSIMFTLMIIVFLVLSGPVNAVNLSVGTDKDEYDTDDTVTFTASVDIEVDERVPIQNVTLTVRDSNGDAVKTCVFMPDGTEISGCENMVIDPDVTLDYIQGYGYGYGYGYGESGGYGYQNTDFGYGYGYGYVAGTMGELKYTITWDLGAEGLGEGAYDAQLSAVAESDAASYTFLSQETSFDVVEDDGDGGDTGGTTTGGGDSTCTPRWICEKWGECISSGIQTRTCIDEKNCNTDRNKPDLIRNCVYVAPKGTATPSGEETGRGSGDGSEAPQDEETSGEGVDELGEGGIPAITGFAVADFLDSKGGVISSRILLFVLLLGIGIFISNKKGWFKIKVEDK